MNRPILFCSLLISLLSDINCMPEFSFNIGNQQNNRAFKDSGQKIRLTGGKKGVHVGFLEIKPFEGARNWQLVCNDASSWDDQAAKVACQQMGYYSGAMFFEIGQ